LPALRSFWKPGLNTSSVVSFEIIQPGVGCSPLVKTTEIVTLTVTVFVENRAKWQISYPTPPFQKNFF